MGGGGVISNLTTCWLIEIEGISFSDYPHLKDVKRQSLRTKWDECASAESTLMRGRGGRTRELGETHPMIASRSTL